MFSLRQRLCSLFPPAFATLVSVILDNRLSMAEQVTVICRACYYQLRQLRSVVQSLRLWHPMPPRHLFTRVYKLSPRQLQCLVVRHCGQPVPTTAVSAERRGAVGHGLSAIWTHHAGPALVALVTRPSASRVQAGNARPQVLERPSPDVPGWLLSTDWRPSPRNEISGDLVTPRAAHKIYVVRTATDHLLSQGQASGTACLLIRSVTVQSRFQETAKDSPVWITIAALVRLNWYLRNLLTYTDANFDFVNVWWLRVAQNHIVKRLYNFGEAVHLWPLYNLSSNRAGPFVYLARCVATIGPR